jgi:hypothetical protein
MLDRLKPGVFEQLPSKNFRLLRSDAPPLDLVLVETRRASRGDGAPGPRLEPFSLLFVGPVAPILPQSIYLLENETLGRLEIFLVPIGADAQGVKYEAIFN